MFYKMLFVSSLLVSGLQAQNMDRGKFLETIASTEAADWDQTVENLSTQYPDLKDSTLYDELNRLTTEISTQNNLSLIESLKRAVQNYNEFAKEKTEPFTLYYKNYQPPAFSIPNIELTLDVEANRVLVTSNLQVQRKSGERSLVLNGVGHKVFFVELNGKVLSRNEYRITPNELILLDAPKENSFSLVIKSEIDPFHNQSLEGLYLSGKVLTTQCESEGARRIFYTLDRPDVLSRITTTIIADANKYPYRLSNGNLLEECVLEDGRKKIVWEDPIPKPSYLFATVLGDFSKLEDSFTTRSGRKVILETYVEQGKEARASYSLTALKAAMHFDQEFFDREYDLDYLKMVAIPDFNSGAMENKGLMIFNETALLVDQHSGTDANFRQVATTVAHEYFHNWSGNRVTVRNWFELALKEAFTDMRAMLFGEWMFDVAFNRPKDVAYLREFQFPEELSEMGHPIMVESYVNPRSIYDSTTYTKGREVFRTLQNYMNMKVEEGFRKAQNLYFSLYDGQAVTFRELLSAADQILKENTKESIAQFERWFNQQGTPIVTARIDYKPKGKALLTVTQSCIHPKTGKEQEPLLIPFSYEFLKEDGSVAIEKKNFVLSKKTHEFKIETKERLIPIFMHNFSAPVCLDYNYSMEDLATLMKGSTDSFSQWEAGQNYALAVMKEMLNGATANAKFTQPYFEALANPNLSSLAKAQILQIPSLRAMAQKYDVYDFPELKKVRDQFIQRLATDCQLVLVKIIEEHPEPTSYASNTDQMQIRELRGTCFSLLSKVDPNAAQNIYADYLKAQNFTTTLSSFRILVHSDSSLKKEAILDFYNKAKDDRMLLLHWLRIQASSPFTTVADLKELMKTEGFDPKNPNQLRSILTVFTLNLDKYHDSKGEGYAFLVDQIIEVGAFNPHIAYGSLATVAFIDFEKLPTKQQKLMAKEMKRLLDPEVPVEIRNLAKKMLESVE